MKPIYRADVARAIDVAPHVIRDWTAQIGSCSEAPVDGWREYSTVDIARYALVKALSGLGMTVEEAGDFAHVVLLTKSQRHMSYATIPDQVVIAWCANGKWHIKTQRSDETRLVPAPAFCVVMLSEVIGEALARLDGYGNV